MDRSGKTNRPESEDKQTGVGRQTDRSQKTNPPKTGGWPVSTTRKAAGLTGAGLTVNNPLSSSL